MKNIKEILRIKYGGERIRKAGCYWNPYSGRFITASEQGSVLPGDSRTTYVRIPVLLLLLLGPVLGGLYVLLLPIVMIGTVFTAAIRTVAPYFGASSRALIQRASLLPWFPGRSYLAKWAHKDREKMAKS